MLCKQRIRSYSLSNVVGMSRDDIHKQLRQWHAEGLVDWDHGYYTILNLEALRAL